MCSHLPFSSFSIFLFSYSHLCLLLLPSLFSSIFDYLFLLLLQLLSCFWIFIFLFFNSSFLLLLSFIFVSYFLMFTIFFFFYAVRYRCRFRSFQESYIFYRIHSQKSSCCFRRDDAAVSWIWWPLSRRTCSLDIHFFVPVWHRTVLSASSASILEYSTYFVLRFPILPYFILLYFNSLHFTKNLYCAVLYSTVLYCTARLCTLLYSTLLYGTVLLFILLYCTVL